MVDALLDYDLVDFVLSIPREHTLWRRLVIKELRGLHQNLMKIPLHGYSHPVSSANLLILLKMMARRLPLIRRLVPGEPKPINGFANFLRNQSDSFKRTLLDGRAISRGLYNIGAIKRLLDEHSSGEQDHTRLLYRLISLELWFRFLEDAYHFNGFQVRSICRERPFTKEGLEMRT
jgi:hypothetical protein